MVETRPTPASSQASIYKQLHKHKRLSLGIGLRFKNGAARADAINEAEEDCDYDQEIREDKKEEDSDDDSLDDNDSNEDYSEQDSRAEEADPRSPQARTNQQTVQENVIRPAV